MPKANRAGWREAPRKAVFAAILWSIATLAPSAADAAERSQSFAAWVQDFKQTAARAGVPSDVLETAFADVELNSRVVELDQRQPEFATPIWSYLNRLVTDQRVQDGRAGMRTVGDRLRQIEARYGVSMEVVAAIWGVESNFGQNRGSYSVVEALATLAYDGRRENFGRNQLLEALKILANGDITADKMVGSWAGAMGHTQFIPTSYQNYAVDFDGDGRRDIWAEDPIDALASTANYLANFGWRADEPWGMVVRLPEGFDFSLIGDLRLPTGEWAERGVLLHNGADLPRGFEDAELILPAGVEGPAFLVLNNFRTIMHYNKATSYALAVSLLSERLGGAGPREFRWPEDERPLSRSESKELQTALNELGFDTGGVDGVLGRRSRSAVRAFQRSQSMIPDGYPSMGLLELVRAALAARTDPSVLAIATGEVQLGDVREMQALLTGIGYDTGGVDGRVGSKTRRAISRFARARGLVDTEEPSLKLLAELRRAVRGE